MQPSLFVRLATISFMLYLAASCGKREAGSTLTYGELKEGFENPSGTALPKVYWWWLNGYTDSLRIKAELLAVTQSSALIFS